MQHPNYKILALSLILSLFLTSCGTPKILAPNYEQGGRAFENFIEISKTADTEHSPYNYILNLRYKTPDSGYRLGAYLWSNGSLSSSVRLDIQNAVGSTVAKIKEDQNHFIMYDLENNVVYTGKDTQKALYQLNIPLPFNLKEVIKLLNGQYLNFFGIDEYSSVIQTASTKSAESIFVIKNTHFQGNLHLKSNGLPALWENASDASSNGNAWQIEFSYLHDSNAVELHKPHRVTITHEQGYSISLQLRMANRLNKEFTLEQLDLKIPDDDSILYNQL